jgi:hypothetical protein
MGLKLARLGITTVSLSLATAIFQEQYMVQVYTQKKSAPSLYLLYAYYLGFDVVLNVVLVLVLYLLSVMYNIPSSPSIFDENLIYRNLVDYGASTTMLVLVSLIIASVVQSKQYFSYELEGPRAIRACKQITLYITVVFTFVPFFVVSS